jgi:hypothetical protein
MNLYHNFGGRTLVFAVLVTRCHLRCLRHLDGMALDPLNSATRCWALLLSERVSVGQPLLVASPSEAHVGHFLPDCPVAPRLPGSFLRFELPGRSQALFTCRQCEINAARDAANRSA